MEHGSGWMPDGFLAWTFAMVWLAVVLVHGLWRSLSDAKPDPIRPPGPPE